MSGRQRQENGADSTARKLQLETRALRQQPFALTPQEAAQRVHKMAQEAGESPEMEMVKLIR